MFYALIRIRFDVMNKMNEKEAEEFLKNNIRIINAKIIEKKLVGWYAKNRSYL